MHKIFTGEKFVFQNIERRITIRHFSIHKQSCRHLDEIRSDNNSAGTCLMVLSLGTVCDTVLFIFTGLVLILGSFVSQRKLTTVFMKHTARVWEQG